MAGAPAQSHSGGLPLSCSLEPLAAFDASAIQVQPVEPVDSRYGRFGARCLALRGVLTPEECRYLIEQLASGPLEPTGYRDDYRRNDRCVYESPELAELLWRRLQPLAQDLALAADHADPSRQRRCGAEGDDGDDGGCGGGCPAPLRLPLGRGGLWRPLGLNECFRFCRYAPGGFFRAHCDGTFVRSEEEMSLFTCMFYLDGGLEGGSTRFLALEGALREGEHLQPAAAEAVLAEVEPEPGLCLLFFQPGLLHEGSELRAGSKHILRTDVMFRRDPASRPQRTPSEQEAWDLAQEAAAAEAAGECDRACQLYRRAFKLDPRLERQF